MPPVKEPTTVLYHGSNAPILNNKDLKKRVKKLVTTTFTSFWNPITDLEQSWMVLKALRVKYGQIRIQDDLTGHLTFASCQSRANRSRLAVHAPTDEEAILHLAYLLLFREEELGNSQRRKEAVKSSNTDQ